LADLYRRFNWPLNDDRRRAKSSASSLSALVGLNKWALAELFDRSTDEQRLSPR
jgi:hypothetical protein